MSWRTGRCCAVWAARCAVCSWGSSALKWKSRTRNDCPTAVKCWSLVNLLLAPGLAWLGREAEVFWLFAGAQLVLGCFNLLPVRPLDGGRLLWLAAAWRHGPFQADRLCAAVGLAAALALTAGSTALCLRTGSAPFLMIGALGTLFAALGGKKGLSNLRKACKM